MKIKIEYGKLSFQHVASEGSRYNNINKQKKKLNSIQFKNLTFNSSK